MFWISSGCLWYMKPFSDLKHHFFPPDVFAVSSYSHCQSLTVGKALQSRISELLSENQFDPVRVPPHCWYFSWHRQSASVILVFLFGSRKKGIDSSATRFLWFFQTFLFGFASLGLLLKYDPEHPKRR
uniref:Transmembrane protein 254 n=3 Tax=Nothobranchius TaxID=28779 RepID=A0A1A8B8G4_NOTFU